MNKWGMVMRRVRSIILVLVLTLAMTACGTYAEVSSENANSQNEEVSESDSEELSENDCGESEGADTSEVASETSEEVAENSESESETTEELSEEENVSEEESISEESEPEFTVEEYSADLYVKKAVNVRIGPSTDYEKIGGLSKGQQIQVTGIADTGWYRIEYNGSEAYVSSNYLVDEATYQAILAEEEAAALAAQQAASEQAAQQATEQTNTGGYKEQVVAIMNQERSAAGVGGITQNANLDNLAQIRAQEIVTSFSHTRPNGTSCFTVFEENGVTYMVAGENIAAGYGTPEEVMVGWMNSEGHRANILNGNFTQVGIGYYTDPNSTYGTYWVQIFSN